MSKPNIHWSDITAERIIKQIGEKDVYTLASGITPSGTVHFGNFREVITVDLVARALREKGKQVRFIFSWDDYDTFRKVPKNMPNQDKLEPLMFNPIVDVPDPYGKEESYAAHHEKSFESQLKKVGVDSEFIYQAKKYQAGDYKDQIKKVLKKTATIKEILDEHRSSPLADEWLPVSIYCENCNRDKIETIKWDQDSTLDYQCSLCSHKGSLDLNTTKLVKLPWRVDWPMRWAYESVDFEPGGKDHSSQGGSFTTAKIIVDKVFSAKAPIYLQYDFVSIKGAGGKMSSSSGNLITVNDVLEIYEPEMVRWIFASYKTNVDFAVSFDLDVLKTYEDFDKMERLAFGVDQGNEKKTNMAKRVYELSQIGDHPEHMPIQPSFRHLCNILQIHDLDMNAAKSYYSDQIKTPRDEVRFNTRATCALNWLEKYAPDEFKFSINKAKPSDDLPSDIQAYFTKLSDYLGQNWDQLETDKELHEKMYEIIHELKLDPKDVFKALYQRFISMDKGPKLAGFIRTIGKEKVLALL